MANLPANNSGHRCVPQAGSTAVAPPQRGPSRRTGSSPQAAACAPIPEARLQLLLRRLCNIYTQNFTDSASGRSLLRSHGLTDFRIVARHGLGYCNGGLCSKLPRKTADRTELVSLGVLDANGTEYFADRIIFPIIGADGRHVNLWGSDQTEPPRFLPRRPVGIWNLLAARHAAELYVTVDPIDALSLIGAGFTNTVALHPGLGEPDDAALRSFGVQRLHLVTGDTPPAELARTQLAARLQAWDCGRIVLPGSGRVDEFLRREGAQSLAAALHTVRADRARQIPGLRPLPDGFSLTLENRTYEVRGLQLSGRHLTATFRVERGDQWHIDTFDLNLARARKEFLREVARIFEEPTDVIASDLGKLLTACEVRAAQPDFHPPIETADRVPECDRGPAEAMARDPRLIDLILEDFGTLGVVGESLNKLLCYVAMTSRKQRHPVSVMFVSSSGAGKNTVADAARDLCPPEERVEATNLSGKALFHLDAGALKNKLLAIDEREGARQAYYALRVLISESRLITKVATKDPASGKLRTDTNRVEGPVAVLITTTDPDTDAETRSRFILTSVDESIAQTRAIRAQQWSQHTLTGLSAELSRSAVQRRHHAFQRLLQPIPVVFPAPGCIGQVDDRLCSRRNLPKALRLVQAVALLRQFQKPVKQHERINYLEVDETDLKIAAPLIQKLFGSRWGDLSQPSQDLLTKLTELRRTTRAATSHPAAFAFTRREARDFTGLPNTTLHRYLTELVDFEYLQRDRGDFRQRHRYRLEGEPPASPPPLSSDQSATVPLPSLSASPPDQSG